MQAYADVYIPGAYPQSHAGHLVPGGKGSRTSSYKSKNQVEDVYIAVMGVTGAGKSSFIELCSGQKIAVGKGLRSQTQEVEEFPFMLSSSIRVHLVDTPGFDDTDRKDTDVLRDVAGWLGVTFKRGIRLSGMIYLHRIIDVRMQGSAKRNLHMFQKLCGEKCFSQIILATTMWSLVPPEIGAQRERELMDQEDFWGYMYKRGSKIRRHTDQYDRSSALAILHEIVAQRNPVVLRIQKEMSDGLELEQTKAGQQLNADIIKEREKHSRELEELQREKEEALAAANQEAADQISQIQAELAKKIQDGEESQKRLRIDLQKLQAEREEEMQKLLEEIQEQHQKLKAQEELYKSLQANSQSNRSEWQDQMRLMEQNMQKEREKFERQVATMSQKKSGTIRELGEFFQEVWDEALEWIDSL